MKKKFQIILTIVFCLQFITPVKTQESENDKNFKTLFEKKISRLSEDIDLIKVRLELTE